MRKILTYGLMAASTLLVTACTRSVTRDTAMSDLFHNLDEVMVHARVDDTAPIDIIRPSMTNDGMRGISYSTDYQAVQAYRRSRTGYRTVSITFERGAVEITEGRCTSASAMLRVINCDELPAQKLADTFTAVEAYASRRHVTF
jgi:hypothetical protein